MNTYLSAYDRRKALAKLGYNEDPFTPSADPRFLYLSSQHGDVLNRTQEIIEGHRGLVVIEGTFGVGKSTVARRLESIYSAYPKLYEVVFVHTASYETEYVALLDISFALSLERRKGMTMQWRELESFLVDKAELGSNVVIILDDAQMMKPSALSFVHHLYNFDITKKLAQVILFGQPEIVSIFAKRLEVQSRVSSWFRLNPLSIDETLEMIRFRSSVAGRTDLPLSQSCFIELWEETQGIPRRVVSLCSCIIDVLIKTNVHTADDALFRQALNDYKRAIKVSDFPLE